MRAPYLGTTPPNFPDDWHTFCMRVLHLLHMHKSSTLSIEYGCDKPKVHWILEHNLLKVSLNLYFRISSKF